MLIVNARPQSIPKYALIDNYGGNTNNNGYIEISNNAIDLRIITLPTGLDIAKGTFISSVFGMAIPADYATGAEAIGIAVSNAVAGGTVDIQINGIVNYYQSSPMFILYLGSLGQPRIYGYEADKYLQKLAINISNEQILLQIGNSSLML